MKMTLKIQALFFMVSILIGLSLVYTYESIRTEKEIIRKEILKRAEAITTLATKAGELPIYSGNPEQMKSAVSFLRANVEVSSVTFYDKARRLLVHDGPPVSAPLPELSPEISISMLEGNDAFVFFAPVRLVRSAEGVDFILGGENGKEVKETLGWVRLAFSKSSMRQNEREIVVRGVLLAAIFTAVGSLLMYLLISVALRPLKRMVQMADEIAHGDLTREVAIERQDEIGALTNAFQLMRKAIGRVLEETNGLIVAVRAGRLDSRGNAEAFEGGWRELVTGINELTDAFVGVNEELKVSKEAAETASRAKSDFLSSMSHELRTPLNAILGYAQILKRQENLTRPQRHQLEIMQSSGEHLLMLINDILDLGKIEAEKMEIEEAGFDLHALLRQVYHLTKLSAEQKGLHLELRAETVLPAYVSGDERKLRQILLNLLANAVRYTKTGSITLRAGYGAADAEVLRCEVTDTGVGIPQDQMEAIFEPFTQLAGERQVTAGTGLGLNISKRLLALMRGKIGVESVCGRGSTFWFELTLPPITERLTSLEAAVGEGGEGEPATPERPASAAERESPEEALVPPPPEELERLYHLAMRGDLLQIEARAGELEKMEQDHRWFAGRLRELSAACKAKAVLALVERYRGEAK